MIPATLLDAIADEIGRIGALASDMGAELSIDPGTLLMRDIALHAPGLWSPNRHCRLVPAADGWIAVNLARPDDLRSVAAWLECDEPDEPWRAVMQFAPERTAAWLLERAILLGLPVAVVGESLPATASAMHRVARPDRPLRVLDFSALWAGPLCGGLLARAGLEVTKAHDPARPDPTAVSTPAHHHRLNGGKRHIALSLASPALAAAIRQADVLITSARPHALARLEVTPETVFSLNPGMIWVAITAHGFTGEAGQRVGFGDDCAAAGGLVDWVEGNPRFLGDALADPLTGLRAAHLALDAIVHSRSGLIDVALASTAAEFASRAGLR